MSSWWFSIRPAHLRGCARVPGLLPLFILTVKEDAGQQRSILPSFASSSKDTYRSPLLSMSPSLRWCCVPLSLLSLDQKMHQHDRLADPPVRYIMTVPWSTASQHQNCLSKLQAKILMLCPISACEVYYYSAVVDGGAPPKLFVEDSERKI